MRVHRSIIASLLVAAAAISACSSSDVELDAPPDAADLATATSAPPPAVTSPKVATPNAAFYAGTLPLDGNRVIAGAGSFPEARIVDIELPFEPVWILGVPFEDGSLWLAVSEDGETASYQVSGTDWREADPPLGRLPAGAPPALVVSEDEVRLVEDDRASAFSPPFEAPLSGVRAVIDEGGDLLFSRAGKFERLDIEAPPDARILADAEGRLLVLGSATERYDHGVLGDAIESQSLFLIDANETPPAVRRIDVEPGTVVEGLSPIWADLDGDGLREILVTLSERRNGARLVAYAEDGQRIAASEPIGRGYRWMHQIAVAPFEAGTAPRIAVVLTPHIGGIIQFFELRGDRLELTGQLPGYSSHRIGSRNMDMALAADLDGDGVAELVVADQSGENLAGVQYKEGTPQVVWAAPLPAMLVSNLNAVTLASGEILLGAGLEGGLLRLWVP